MAYTGNETYNSKLELLVDWYVLGLIESEVDDDVKLETFALITVSGISAYCKKAYDINKSSDTTII